MCTMSCDELFDTQRAVEIIRDIGLVNTPDGRILFGPDAKFMTPRSANSETQGVYQIPDQVSRAMQTVAAHAAPVRTYLEYGVFTGWNACLVSTFLSRFAPAGSALKAYAADITMHFMTRNTTRLFNSIGIKYVDSRTQLPAMLDGMRARGELIDVCYIDAYHSYAAVRADFERVGPYCRLVLFHDVYDWSSFASPRMRGGVPAFWAHLKANVRNSSRILEIVDNRGIFPPSLGFGVLLPNEHGVAALDAPAGTMPKGWVPTVLRKGTNQNKTLLVGGAH